MYSLKLNETVYNIQDSLFQNKMINLNDFKTKVFENIFIPSEQLKKIYAFIESVHQHPKRVELAQALKLTFKIIVNELVILDRSSENVINRMVELHYTNLPFTIANVIYCTLPQENFMPFEYRTMDIAIKVPIGFVEPESAFIYNKYANSLTLMNNKDSFILSQCEPINDKSNKSWFKFIKDLYSSNSRVKNLQTIKLKNVHISSLIHFERLDFFKNWSHKTELDAKNYYQAVPLF